MALTIAISQLLSLVGVTAGFSGSSEHAYAAHPVDIVVSQQGTADRLSRLVAEEFQFRMAKLSGVTARPSVGNSGSRYLPLIDQQYLTDRNGRITLINELLKKGVSGKPAARTTDANYRRDAGLLVLAEGFVKIDTRTQLAGAIGWMHSVTEVSTGNIGMARTMERCLEADAREWHSTHEQVADWSLRAHDLFRISRLSRSFNHGQFAGDVVGHVAGSVALHRDSRIDLLLGELRTCFPLRLFATSKSVNICNVEWQSAC